MFTVKNMLLQNIFFADFPDVISKNSTEFFLQIFVYFWNTIKKTLITEKLGKHVILQEKNILQFNFYIFTGFFCLHFIDLMLYDGHLRSH